MRFVTIPVNVGAQTTEGEAPNNKAILLLLHGHEHVCC